jgi:ATP-dependent Lon protease
MSHQDEFLFSAEKFSGTVRLFPLPNLVLFPHVMQPLQIFEPRYLKMLDDALAGDRLLAMALLQPGWESDYEGRPKIAPIVCVGRVLTHQRLDDGRQNVLLVGLRRARIIRELDPRRPYREAKVELLDDRGSGDSGASRAALQRKMLEFMAGVAPQIAGKENPFDAVLAGDVPLGMLTDIITYILPLDLSFKQCLLAETNVERRARRLLDHVSALPGSEFAENADRSFPPEFSVN